MFRAGMETGANVVRNVLKAVGNNEAFFAPVGSLGVIKVLNLTSCSGALIKVFNPNTGVYYGRLVVHRDYKTSAIFQAVIREAIKNVPADATYEIEAIQTASDTSTEDVPTGEEKCSDTYKALIDDLREILKPNNIGEADKISQVGAFQNAFARSMTMELLKNNKVSVVPGGGIFSKCVIM